MHLQHAQENATKMQLHSGGRLYKVRSKRFAASRDLWEPPSSFVPRYTTMLLEYFKKKRINLDMKDVSMHLIMHDRDSDDSPSTIDTIFRSH